MNKFINFFIKKSHNKIRNIKVFGRIFKNLKNLNYLNLKFLFNSF